MRHTLRSLPEWLKMDELEDGAVYELYCRNAACGVWRAEKKGFEIPRLKFGFWYLFMEYHWDHDSSPTAKPIKKLTVGELPTESLVLLEFLKVIDSVVWQERSQE